MTQDFSWLGPSRRRSEPTPEYLATFWTLRGPSNRDLTCSAYRIETALELRAAYVPGGIVRTELFRGADADERLAEKTDLWRRMLIQTGFREIAK